MKTKLPLPLRRALLAVMLSSTLASASAIATDIISINFGGNAANFLDNVQYGIDGITTQGSSWNKLTGGNQESSLINNSNQQSGSIKVVQAQATWGGGPANNAANPNTAILNTYMDLGANNQYTISVQTDFLKAEVYLIFAGDGSEFSSVNVNGTNYTAVNGETVVGTDSWGNRTNNIDTIKGECGDSLLKEGFNYLKISGSSGDFEIKNNPSGASKRATIAGMQIVDTYTGTVNNFDLTDASVSIWTSTALGSDAWTNAIAGAGQSAAITAAAGGSSITIDNSGGDVVVDALWIKSGQVNLSGGSLSYVNAEDAQTRVDKNANLIINSNMSLAGFVGAGTITLNSDVTLVGSEQREFKGTLSGSGSLIIASGVSQTLSNLGLFTGNLLLNGGNLTINDVSASSANLAISTIKGSGGTINLLGLGDSTGGLGGNTSVLNIANTFEGTVNVLQGSLSYTNGTAGQNADWVNNNRLTINLAGGSLSEGIVSTSGNLTYSIANQITFAENKTSSIRVYANNTLNVTGAMTGTGTFAKTGAGTINLRGDINLSAMQVNDGSVYILGSNNQFAVENIIHKNEGTVYLNFGSAANESVITSCGLRLSVGSATVNFYTGSQTSTQSILGSDKGGSRASLFNQYAGSILNVTGTGNDYNNSHSFLLAHWNGTAVYNLSGGILNSLGSAIALGLDGQGTFNMTGGTINSTGLILRLNGSGTGASHFNMSGGTFNIGATGINSQNMTRASLNLGNGTLGAYANWEGRIAMSLGYAGGQSAGTVSAPIWTTINTTDSTDEALGGHKVTLSGVISNVADSVGGLNIIGKGEVLITGNNTFTGGVKVDNSKITLGHANALGAAGSRNLTLMGGGNTKDTATAIQFGTGITGAIDNLTFAQGANINWGGTKTANQNVGNLVVGGNNTLFTFASNSAISSDQLTAGTVTLNGSLMWDVFASGMSAGDRVTLLNYTTLNGQFSDFQLNLSSDPNARQLQGHLIQVDSSVVLEITSGGAANLTWASGTNVWQAGNESALWDTDVPDKWFCSGDKVNFIQMDGKDLETVTIEGNVQPGSIVINGVNGDNRTDYRFEGSGSIVGQATSLTIQSGSLTLANENTFGGLTTVAENAELNLAHHNSIQNSLISGAGVVNVAWGAEEVGNLNIGELTGTLSLNSGIAGLSVAGLNKVGTLTFAGGSIQMTTSGVITHTIAGSAEHAALINATGQQINFQHGNLIQSELTIKGGTVTFNDTSFDQHLIVDGGRFNLNCQGSSTALGANGSLTIKNGAQAFADWQPTIYNASGSKGNITMEGNTSLLFNAFSGSILHNNIILSTTADTYASLYMGNNISSYLAGTISGTGNLRLGNPSANDNLKGLHMRDGWVTNSYLGKTLFATTGNADPTSYVLSAAPTQTDLTPFGTYDSSVAGSATLVYAGNGIIEFNGNSHVTQANLKAGFEFAANSALTFTNMGNLTVTGQVNVGAHPVTLNLNGSNVTLDGSMMGTGLKGTGTLNLRTSGTGSLALGATSTGFTGVINSVANTSLNLIGDASYSFSLTGATALSVASGVKANLTGALNTAGSITLGEGSVLHYTGKTTAANAFISTISGPGTFDMTGGGMLRQGATHNNELFTVNGGARIVMDTPNWGENSNLGKLGTNSPNFVLDNATLVLTGTQDNHRKFTIGTGGASVEIAEGFTITNIIKAESHDRIQMRGDNCVFTLGGAGNGVYQTETAGTNIFYTTDDTKSRDETLSLVKNGTGTWTFGGTNTFGGGTTINEGTLIISNLSALGVGNTTVHGGIFDMNNLAYAHEVIMTGGNLAHAGAFASTVSINQTGKTAAVMDMGGLNGDKITSFLGTATNDSVTRLTNITGNLTLNQSQQVNFSSSMVGTTRNNDSLVSGGGVIIGNGATITLNFTSEAATEMLDNMGNAGSSQYLSFSNQSLTNHGNFIFHSDYALFKHLFDIAGTDNGSLVLNQVENKNILLVKTTATLDIHSQDQTGFDYVQAIINNGKINITTQNAEKIVLSGFSGTASSAMLNLGNNANQVVELIQGPLAEEILTYQGNISGAGQIIKQDDHTFNVHGTVSLGSLTINNGTFNFATREGLKNEIAGTLTLESTGTLGLSGKNVVTEVGRLDAKDGSTISMANGAILSLNGDVALNANVVGNGMIRLNSGNFSLGGGSLSIHTALELLNSAQWNVDQNVTLGAVSGNGSIQMNGHTMNLGSATSVFSGTIQGSGTINKTGSGIQTFIGDGNENLNFVVNGSSSQDGLSLKNIGDSKASYGSVVVNSGLLSIGNQSGAGSNVTNVQLESLKMSSGSVLNLTFAGNTQNATSSVPLTVSQGTQLTDTVIQVNCINPSAFHSYNSEGFSITLLQDLSGNLIETGSTLTMGFLNTLFDWKLREVNGSLIAVGEGKSGNYYAQAGLTHNSKAVSNLLYGATEYIIYSPDSELKTLADYVANNIATGNVQGASQAMSAMSGSSLTSMNVAQRDGYRDQLSWIRNRTVTMGANQDMINQDMPYYHMWVQGTGGYNDLKSSGDESGYTMSYWGATTGVNIDLTESWTVGAAFTANFGNLDANAADVASGSMDSYYISLFARMQKHAWAHTFILTGGWNEGKLNRTASYGDQNYRMDSSTNGGGFGAMYELTYDCYLNEENTSLIQPLLNISVVSSKLKGFDETGAGDASLRVDEMKMTTTTLALGGRWLGLFGSNLFGRESLGEVRLNVAQDMGDERGEANVGFMGNPSMNQTIRGAKVGSTALQLGGSISVPVQENGTIFVEANADFRNKQNSVNGSLGYRYSF